MQVCCGFDWVKGLAHFAIQIYYPVDIIHLHRSSHVQQCPISLCVRIKVHLLQLMNLGHATNAHIVHQDMGVLEGVHVKVEHVVQCDGIQLRRGSTNCRNEVLLHKFLWWRKEC